MQIYLNFFVYNPLPASLPEKNMHCDSWKVPKWDVVGLLFISNDDLIP